MLHVDSYCLCIARQRAPSKNLQVQKRLARPLPVLDSSLQIHPVRLLCFACLKPSQDVYSFGVVLWELWTLREPFEGINYHALLHMMSTSTQPVKPQMPGVCMCMCVCACARLGRPPRRSLPIGLQSGSLLGVSANLWGAAPINSMISLRCMMHAVHV